MIYITGDCHQQFERFNARNFPEQREMTKEDCVIICGDFGGVWNKDVESPTEKHLLDWLEEKPFTLLFADGNHENFDRLYAYPVEEWHGGKVHKIRSSVIHLMRGQIYDIEDKSVFVFGGARSHDISGGILEPDDPDFRRQKKMLDLTSWLPYRINHLSWWAQEMPSTEEMEEGWRNLAARGNQVDFIVTHCCCTSTQNTKPMTMATADSFCCGSPFFSLFAISMKPISMPQNPVHGMTARIRARTASPEGFVANCLVLVAVTGTVFTGAGAATLSTTLVTTRSA